MKATKKEKILLGVLAGILIVVLYYQFVFTVQSEKLQQQKLIRDEVQNEFDDAMNTINSLEKNKENLKIVRASVVDKTAGFYPTIVQEKIILELNTLLEESGLEGNIAFSPIEVSSVDPLENAYEGAVEDKFNEVSDYYIAKDSYTGEGEEPQGELVENNSEEVENDSVDDDLEISDSEQSETDAFTNVEQLKVAINFTGTYEALTSFTTAIDNYARNIAVTNLAVSASSVEDVTGTISLEFYAVPKITNDDLENYLSWDLNNTYGKNSPFSEGVATGAYATTIEQLAEEQEVNDFVMMVKSAASEFPTLTIGSANDIARESYIYADSNKVQDLTIDFTEEDGNLYYKYNTEDSVYPKTESAKEFNTISNEIVLEITSESRINNDEAGVNVKINNNTSKTVSVIIKGDDSSNPRVNITSEGGKVNVTKR